MREGNEKKLKRIEMQLRNVEGQSQQSCRQQRGKTKNATVRSYKPCMNSCQINFIETKLLQSYPIKKCFK